MEKVYLSVSEVAQYMGISEASLRMRVFRNQIPYVRLSERKVLFKKDELDSFLESKRVKATQARR